MKKNYNRYNKPLYFFFLLIGIATVFVTLKYREDIYYTYFKTNKIKVTLYFAHPQSESLLSEKRWINRYPHLHEQASALIDELIKGPKGNGIRTLPYSAHVKHLIVKDGVATVDFSAEISSNHPGGSTAELLTIYSVVNTLIQNFQVIKKVQLMIEGQYVKTLAGHINCSVPLALRKDLINGS